MKNSISQRAAPLYGTDGQLIATMVMATNDFLKVKDMRVLSELQF